MAKKFLDESGVSTLWNKIKSMFVKKANLGENVNFNDVTEGGMYRYNSSITNGPDGAGSHGQLLVVRGANDTIAQLCFPYADSRMFLRTGNAVNNPNGTWQGWVAIANTNDLNNYLPLSGGRVNGYINIAGNNGVHVYYDGTSKYIGLEASNNEPKLQFYDGANYVNYKSSGAGGVIATEEYVNNKIPTFSFSNGVLTITTH